MGRMGKQRLRAAWAGAALVVSLTVLLGACGDNPLAAVPPQAPGVTLPAHFQWHIAAQRTATLAIPISARAPGPTVSVRVAHQVGYGAPITGPQVMRTAATVGQRVISTEIGQLKAAGWQPLFTPTVTGSFPSYVLYVTLRGAGHYCFVEYSATAVTAQLASQQLDIFQS